MTPLISKWRCVLCGKAVETALMFALVKDPTVGIAVGKCCYEKLREPGVITDPGSIFTEVILDTLIKEADKLSMAGIGKSIQELAKLAGFDNAEEATIAFLREQENRPSTGDRRTLKPKKEDEKDPTRLPKGWATLGNENNKVH